MPLYNKIVSDSFELAVWRIEEPLSFFKSHFDSLPDIQNENKKLQWLATRFLSKQLVGAEAEVLNNETGKPHLKDPTHHISISHCPRFAAVIAGKTVEVGVDLEPVHNKVDRVAKKFLTENELAAIGTDNRIEKLILYWSAKESLYKLHGEGGVDFKTQLLIKPFELIQEGSLSAAIATPVRAFANLTIHYRFFEGHVLTYVAI